MLIDIIHATINLKLQNPFAFSINKVSNVNMQQVNIHLISEDLVKQVKVLVF